MLIIVAQGFKIKNTGMKSVKILRESEEEHLTHKMDQPVWTPSLAAWQKRTAVSCQRVMRLTFNLIAC